MLRGADLRLLRLFLAALCLSQERGVPICSLSPLIFRDICFTTPGLLLPLGLRGGGEHGLQVRLLQDGPFFFFALLVDPCPFPPPPPKKKRESICCPRKALIGLKIGLDGAFGNCTTTSRFHCVVEVVGLASASVNFLSS